MMTVKEIMEATGVPRQTILDIINKLFPNKMSKGKMTYLNDVEVSAVSIELKKSHNSNLTGTREVVMTELEEEMHILRAIEIQNNKIARITQRAEINGCVKYRQR